MVVSQSVSATGAITHGIKPNTFVDKTIEFVENSLHLWRDDPTRPHVVAEEEMNSQLCKFLDDLARDKFPMAAFHHEEKQGKRRRVDISAGPTSKAIKASIYDSIYTPFLVLEGKRLPAPSGDRLKEYVTGCTDRSGGIQRFRLCLHGSQLAKAVIIGYVQGDDVNEWLKRINGWIADLRSSGEDSTCVWSNDDRLSGLRDDGIAKASYCESSHTRTNSAVAILLVHLWISMKKQVKVRRKKQNV